MELVIVESPTKARTLTNILPKKYKIVASMGHVRDLPKSELGIDIEKNFEPRYIIPKDKRKAVNLLVKQMQEADKLYLATDPDREGEAISWHLLELIRGKSLEKRGKSKNSNPLTLSSKPYKRVTFHEITSNAVKEAFEMAHDLDQHLIDAQQARRVLDRLVGYQLSPVLWKKIRRGLSAGRVQSVALRLIVEREREIEKFKPVEYWKLEAVLEKETKEAKEFSAWLVEKEGKKNVPKNKKETDQVLNDLKGSTYKVVKVVRKDTKRYPSPPFTTSTLQQAASSRFGLSARQTMQLAQSLYEEGLITYHRTDSVNLADVAIGQIRKFIENQYGQSYLPTSPKRYKVRSKLAQEAHEAIRPTKIQLTIDKSQLTGNHRKLYDLIWKRAVASQVNEAIFDQTTVDVLAKSEQLKANSYIFRANGQIIKFDGWLKVYGVSEEEDQKEEEKRLPELSDGENLDLIELNPTQHFTEPPPRFTEATLIKILEQNGIGRPSTYAPIISTILDRYYVEREEKKLKPTSLGVSVNNFLVENFPEIVDVSFTFKIEEEFDEIANGELEWQPVIKEFWDPFSKQVNKVIEEAERVEVKTEKTDEICDLCGKPMVVRFGRFGKFLACSGFPECKGTKNYAQKIDIKCPQDGGDVVVRRTKKGRTFYGCSNWPNCNFASWTKPGGDKNEEKIPLDQ